MTITDELLTRKELMALFKCSQPTVIRLQTAGKLTPVHIGRAVRYRRSEVEQYLQRSLSR